MLAGHYIETGERTLFVLRPVLGASRALAQSRPGKRRSQLTRCDLSDGRLKFMSRSGLTRWCGWACLTKGMQQ
jgi:hypothetical protein